MIASMAAVGLSPGLGSGSSNPDIDPDEVTPEETPSSVLSFDGPIKTIDETKQYVAIIKTSEGDIKIEFAMDAPQAVNSFAFLAGHGFYNGTAFFFVDKSYFAQAGDPTCDPDSETVCSGVGGPGYTLPIEETAAGHEQWAVVAPVLVEGDQQVHGSQFRILFTPDDRLDGEETVFGKVIDGQDVLESLSNLAPCSVVTQDTCDPDLTQALVIEDVIVEPA